MTIQQYKRVLVHLFLLFLVSHPIQGALFPKANYSTVAIDTLPEVCDYTIYANQQVAPLPLKVENKADLEDSLIGETFILEVNLKNKKKEMLLAAVLQSEQDHKYYKYLFSSNKLLKGKKVVQKAYKYGYHRVKTNAQHVVIALMEWLGWSYEQWYHHRRLAYHTYSVKAVYTNQPVCASCYFFCFHMFKIKLLWDEKGCLSRTWPESIAPLPFSAKQYLNVFLHRYLKKVKQEKAYAQLMLLQQQQMEANFKKEVDKDERKIDHVWSHAEEKAKEEEKIDDVDDEQNEIIAYLKKQLAKRDDILENLTKRLLCEALKKE